MQIKKYPHKNLNRNRILYFQIGLCLVLVLLLISVQWKSYGKSYDPVVIETPTDFIEKEYVVNIPKKKPERIEDKKEIKKKTEPKERNDKREEIFINPTPEQNTDPNEILSGLENPIPAPIPDVPSPNVEEFPVFPGCEVYNDREERKDCMNSKLYKFIGKHFDTRLASDLNLSGTQKIYVLFKVSYTGEVIFLNSRAIHPELQREAKRVIEKLPELTPGKMGNEPVNVLFSLPINFKVNE